MDTPQEFTPEQVAKLIDVIIDFHWMARRYADGRMTYATSLFNNHTDALLELGIPLNMTADQTLYAQDGMGRRFDGLNVAHAHLAAISAAEQRLATCFAVYIETNLSGEMDAFPPFLRDAYQKWKHAEFGEHDNDESGNTEP